MSCTSCKEKKDIRGELMKTTKMVSKGIVWFIVIWTMLGIYGLVTLISKIL